MSKHSEQLKEIDRAMYRLVVKERDYERIKVERLEQELAAALIRIAELEGRDE